jgi:hypothetical protein
VDDARIRDLPDVRVKDWGSSIAGHGGALDRLDSLSASASIFFHFGTFLLLRNGGKRSGSNAENRTIKKSAPYIVQTCARGGRRWYFERGMPCNRGDQRLPGSGELQYEPPGGKPEQMRQRRKRGAIRENRRRWNAPKCGRLAVRENEIRHGEFCVD